MLVDLSLFSFFFLILFLINWNLDDVLLKKINILFFSLLIIFFYNPLLIIIILSCCLFSIIIIKLSNYHKNPNYLYLIFLILLLPEFFNIVEIYRILDISIRNPINTNLVTIGLSFCAIKIFLYVKTEKDINFFNLLYLCFFIPTYVQGPIHSIKNINNFNKIDSNHIVLGLYRISMGTFKLFFITYVLNYLVSNFILDVSLNNLSKQIFYNFNFFQIIIIILSNFILLYLNFSGFVDLSIGGSKLLGITIPENFNNPLVSRDITEFWSRWHITLANFVRSFVYIPLLKKFKNPRLSVILAFVLVGIWHHISPGYLIWGFGHGLLLAYNRKIFIFNKFYSLGNRIILLSSVSCLSFIANFYHLIIK